MAFIPFTDEEVHLAGQVDLEKFLEGKVRLKREGGQHLYVYSDYAGEHDSVGVRKNGWYDYKNQEGGGPISFMTKFMGLRYPEAILTLLGKTEADFDDRSRNQGRKPPSSMPAPAAPKEEKPPFAAPIHAPDMLRSIGYLVGRHISQRILETFVKAGTIYESREPVKDKPGQFFRNLVFLGLDENGVPRHAHMRSNSEKGTFRINVPGSDARHSFHHIGQSDTVYVFEAPIDMLSFITRYPKNWQQHSYVALCGTAEHALTNLLATNPHIKKVVVCLDHDPPGIEAADRLIEILEEAGSAEAIAAILSVAKDWNEDIKRDKGLPYQPAVPHPQYVAAPGVYKALTQHSYTSDKLARAGEIIASAVNRMTYHHGQSNRDGVAEAAEELGALALACAAREYRQIGDAQTPEEISQRLYAAFRPHKNRGKLDRRVEDITASASGLLLRLGSQDLRSREDKLETAGAFETLAMDCAKAIILKRGEDYVISQKEQVADEEDPQWEQEPSAALSM